MVKALAGVGATSLAGIAGSRADFVAGPKGNSMADVGNFSFAARLVCCSMEYRHAHNSGQERIRTGV